MSYQIPFSDRGQLQYANSYVEKFTDGFRWVDNHEFDATLTFEGYYRGRSAGGFRFKDNLYTYYMFMTDIDDLLKTKVIDKGVVSGKWTFVKRGMNYGIKLVAEKEQ
jgi:hypothetical protein